MAKKNIILLLVLTILLGLSAAYQFWWLPRADNSQQETNFLSGVAFGQVDKITVKRGEIMTVLTEVSGQWQTAGDWPVNKVLMETIGQAWQTAAANDIFLVSADKTARPAFKTDGSGLTVQFFQGNNELGAWQIGLTRGGYTYIAPVGSDATYEVKGDLRGAFDYAEWRDFAIWPAPAEFDRLTISRGRELIKLIKDNGNWFWEPDKKTKLSPEKITAIVALMSELSANSLPDTKVTDSGLAKNNLIIEASGQNIKRVLTIGQERVINQQATGEFYVSTNQNNRVYLIRKDQRDVFNVGLKDIQN